MTTWPYSETSVDTVQSVTSPSTYLTGAKENYSFKVCVLIAVYIQFRHTVTEFLQLPDVLHDLLYPVTRKLI